jgi:hypothetical protein
MTHSRADSGDSVFTTDDFDDRDERLPNKDFRKSVLNMAKTDGYESPRPFEREASPNQRRQHRDNIRKYAQEHGWNESGRVVDDGSSSDAFSRDQSPNARLQARQDKAPMRQYSREGWENEESSFSRDESPNRPPHGKPPRPPSRQGSREEQRKQHTPEAGPSSPLDIGPDAKRVIIPDEAQVGPSGERPANKPKQKEHFISHCMDIDDLLATDEDMEDDDDESEFLKPRLLPKELQMLIVRNGGAKVTIHDLLDICKKPKTINLTPDKKFRGYKTMDELLESHGVDVKKVRILLIVSFSRNATDVGSAFQDRSTGRFCMQCLLR